MRGRVFGFSELAEGERRLQSKRSSRQFRKTEHPTPDLLGEYYVDDFAAVSSRTSAMRAAMSDSAVSHEHMKRAPPAPMNV